MKIQELQQAMVEAINEALQSQETTAGEVITVLESTKFDIMCNVRAAQIAQQQRIVKAPAGFNPSIVT